MYDDFMAGYTGNFQNQQVPSNVRTRVQQAIGQGNEPLKGVGVLGTYDKTKIIKMTGPSGEQGEIYANGKMYIIFPGGKSQIRTFPSRPWGIRYMQKRGWVLV